MSATSVVLIIEALLLGFVILFMVALLRSHAEILRRLGALQGERADIVDPASTAMPPARGGPAADIVGETLAGDAVKLAPAAGTDRTLLAFLSTGCAACGSLWAALGDGARVPADARLVIVTKGPEQESVARLEELAPAGFELLLSTAAWSDYAVPSTPHFVLVDGRSGVIAGRGSASSWEQLVTLVEQATADSEQPARTSQQRATRAEEALVRAGIAPGHPSLYPSRAPDSGGESL